MHVHVKNLTELFMGVSNWDEATRASAESLVLISGKSSSDQTQRARLHRFGGKGRRQRFV